MGLATAVGVGTTTISATDPVSSIIGSATLTIPQTTQVGGIITASTTTWSLSNSPYSLSSDVQLAYGSTLAIDPGVVIYGSGHSIKVWGVLNAVGTSSAHIVFNNTNITPGANTSSQPFLINIQFSELNSGNLYQATGSAVYGSLTLDDSILRNTGTLYLWYPIANCFIERNIFLNAGGIEVGTMNGVTVYVSNNVFYQQTGCFIAPCINNYGAFAVENFASYDTSQTIVEYNSFLSTDMIALMLPSGYTAANMIGINNYWNTTDTATIDSMIYDKNDDLGCANYIQYVPFLTAPDPNTPDPSSYIQ